MASLGPRSGRGATRRELRGRSGALLAGVALLLGACAAPPPAPQATAPLPVHAPVSLAVATAPPPITGTEFRELVGVSESELHHRLGPPDLRRHETPAEIWQYRSADCALDLFLYRSRGLYRVAYAEIHARGLIAVSPSSCYAGLLSRHRPLDENRL